MKKKYSIFLENINLDKDDLLFIGEADNGQEASMVMNEFLEKVRFKSYYFRTWIENGRVEIDFGSHVSFFIIKSTNGEPIENLDLFNKSEI